eukprot:COSAG02_NODE_2659_length_8310_cov_10.600901_4_plen_66_part_00
MRTTVVIIVVLMIIGGGIAGAIHYTKKGKAATPTTVMVSQVSQPQPMQAQQAVLVQQPGAMVEGP